MLMSVPSPTKVSAFIVSLWFTAQTFAAPVDFVREVRPIFEKHCTECHGEKKQKSGLRLDVKAAALKGGDDEGPDIVPGKAKESPLIHLVSSNDDDELMPPKGGRLSAAEIDTLTRWINEGAVWPDGVDRVQIADRRDHWSFKFFSALAESPAKVGQNPKLLSIDSFINAKLAENGLHRSPPADPVALVRRIAFDLTGLPPTPEEVSAFVEECRDGSSSVFRDSSLEKLADKFLASPRYGERWAQHWLDVVRYADTHGFEVNTERPNAWPYRDYVIRAFNADTPYDRFIKEQIVGDAMGQDAATGFLVTASVLLPGQIGKDAPSIRLARQDSLDEIVNNVGQTFLGLSVGCARCHDHKFDPITAKDYYAMQAFFSGVQYEERPMRDPHSEGPRMKEAAEIHAAIATLRKRLEAAQPTANTGRVIFIDDEDSAHTTSLKKKNGHGDNPAGAGRGYRDDGGGADHVPNLSRGRYTWWDNVPDADTFTWNPGVEGRFRVWLSWGVHGSGVHTRDARYILDRDGNLDTRDDQTEIGNADQYRFANVADGDSEQVPLWSGLRDAGTQELRRGSRIILRGGKTGTGITADVLVLEEAGAPALFPGLRAPVNPAMNVERFAPIDAKFVRFTVFSTVENNRHQPCIDELEIFAAGAAEKNLALASGGARASSSGDYPDIAIHQLPHINDGAYGNSHSWISNQAGGGWVQIELPALAKIDRVTWSRDREGKFKDRLADRYQIEVASEPGSWVIVARSDDRIPYGTPFDEGAALQRHAPEAGGALKADIGELSRLEKRKTELAQGPVVFGGIFTNPDEIRLLSRGDPEQPKEEVLPAVLSAFGELALPKTTPDQERRKALADWIASPRNPLTARVMVNRIWQGHFGTGLVQTPSDFGHNGMKPTHPQLLDWLAAEFMRSGWSVKHMHRLIVRSETYRQSGFGFSRADAAKAAATLDSDVRFLWRFPGRRLEAESIRDSMLAVSGQLNLAMYGRGFDLFNLRGGLSGFNPVETLTPGNQRRMIYAHKVRREPEAVFGAFDCPDAGQSTAIRRASTTPIQALNLFNSRFTLQVSEAFAARVKKETGDDPAKQINRVYQLALNRNASADEISDAEPVVRRHGLAVLCRAILNSNEFLFVP